jgi:WD40 repeat protein/Flp pilus assembly protein TadD
LAVFEGHKNYIWSVAFSPDGTRLATASVDSTVKLWSVADRRELKTLAGHTASVETVAFSHDGKLLASGGADNATRIWDAETGRQLSVMPGGGEDGSSVRGVAFSPDGHRLATVNSSSTDATIWDVFSGQQVNTFHGHTSSVFAVAYSPDGSQVATSSLDKTARLYDAASGKELLVFTGHSEAVTCVSFSADGSHLATGSEDGTARIWELEQPEESPPLVGHTASLNGVAFSPDGSRIASASDDNTARIWKVSTGEELVTLTHTGAVNGLAFSPDASRIATASSDREAKVFDVNGGAKLFALAGHSAAVMSVAYSHDGRRLITGSSDKTARIWDASTGKEQVTMRTNLREIDSVDLNRDGTRAALGINNHGDGTVTAAQIWDVGSNRPLANLEGDYVWVNHVQFNPDGSRLVTTGYTPPFVTDIWDARSGQKLLKMAGHTAAVLTAAFSPDGQSLATGGEDSTIRVWDLRDGRELLTLTSPKATVRSLAFSPDGKQLASAGSDGIVRLYAVDPMDLMVLSASRLARSLTADECRRYLRRDDCSTTASSKLFAAKEFAQKGDSAAAMKIFSQVLAGNQTGSGDSYAKLLLSELRMSEARERAEAGDLAGAAAGFRAALSLQSRSSARLEQEAASLVSMTEVRNARRLEASGRWTDAAAVLQQAVIFDPKDEEAYVDLADSFYKTAQYDKSVEAMRHAARIRPSVSNMIELANNLRMNKQYPEAVTQLNQVIGLDPDSERAHRILGLTFRDTRDSDRALHEFQTAIVIKPTTFVYQQIASIYDSRKDFRQALDNLNKGKAIEKTDVSLYEDAERIYHEEQGDFRAAYRELAEARAVAPGDLPLAADFAEACLTDGQFQEAIDTVDSLLGARLPSPDLSISDQVALKFIRVAALSFNGRSQDADAARRQFMTYLTALGPFKQTWNYAGTKRFLGEYEMNQDLRAQLLKLLALIELRNSAAGPS